MTIQRTKKWAGVIAILALSMTGVACKDDSSSACLDACSVAEECDVLEEDETFAECNESCDFIDELRSDDEFAACVNALDVAFACSASLSCNRAEILAACNEDDECDGDGVPCFDEVEAANFACSSSF